MFDTFFEFVFRGTLNSIGPGPFIILLAFLVSLMSILLYQSMTPQKRIKQLRKEIEDLTRELKWHKGNPSIQETINKEIMQKNTQIMTSTWLINLISMVPIFFLLSFWAPSTLSFIPLTSNDTFSVDVFFTNTTFINNNFVNLTPTIVVPNGLMMIAQQKTSLTHQYTFNGNNGNYTLQWIINGTIYNKTIIIGEKRYASNMDIIQDGLLNAIAIEYKPLYPMNIFGLKLNWMWEYILYSILWTMLLRKLIDVYY